MQLGILVVGWPGGGLICGKEGLAWGRHGELARDLGEYFARNCRDRSRRGIVGTFPQRTAHSTMVAPRGASGPQTRTDSEHSLTRSIYPGYVVRRSV